MIIDVIQLNCKDVTQLSKKDSIKIYQKWLGLFANRVNEVTGKWRIGNHLWEGFASGMQPSFSENKAIELYRRQRSSLFYIFDESGKHCFQYNTGYDLYILPEDESWTVAFCHDNVVYFSYAE
jgi:hypothetical protein